MADNNTIARPYAQAVFELARDAGALGPWSAALATAKALLADGTVTHFLSTPALSDDERLRFLTGLFANVDGEGSVLGGGNASGKNFLKLLLEYDRVAVLPEISQHFDAMKADVENTVDVTVTSAAPLSEAQQMTIAKALRARLGREINLNTQVDENLIGGAVIRAGDVVIDGSLRSRLQGLSTALTA